MRLRSEENMNQNFQMDYYRMMGRQWGLRGYLDLFLHHELRYLLFLRNRKRSPLTTLRNIRWGRRYGLEILSNQIGGGLYLGHAHNINVNPGAVIGKNCNLNKGATLGAQKRGKKAGSPVLGDDVWVGTNAVIVGHVHIGSDVLIAPNAYVNFDVPDHSVVIGNPGVVHSKNHATEDYISNRV